MADKAFYASTRWRRLRAVFLRSHPLCAECQRKGLLTAAAHVHHKEERKDRPELALDWANLEALCQPCHGRMRSADRQDPPGPS
jgi:5-methylcytosine-specific restriction protein A